MPLGTCCGSANDFPRFLLIMPVGALNHITCSSGDETVFGVLFLADLAEGGSQPISPYAQICFVT